MGTIAIDLFPTATSLTGTSNIVLADGDGSQYPLSGAVAYALEHTGTLSSIGTSASVEVVSVVNGTAALLSALEFLSAGLPSSANLLGTTSSGDPQAIEVDTNWFTLTTGNILSINAFPVSAPLLGMGGLYPRAIQVGSGLSLSSTGTGTATTYTLSATGTGGGGSPITLTDGTTTITNLSTLTIVGGTVSTSNTAGSGPGTITITGGTGFPDTAPLIGSTGTVPHKVAIGTNLSISTSGTGTSTSYTLNASGTSGGGSWQISDGTSTVSSVTILNVSPGAASVSGSGGTATLLTSNAVGFVRPASSSFTLFTSPDSRVSITDYVNGPIDFMHMDTGGNCNYLYQAVTGSEIMVTARISQRARNGDVNTYSPFLGVGFSNSGGTLMVFGTSQVQVSLGITTYTSLGHGGYGTLNFSDDRSTGCPAWLRMYYQASNTSNPFSVYVSQDGYIWDLYYQWNGSSALPAAFGSPVAACFFSDPGGRSGGVRGGGLLNWSLQEGSGSSLNPWVADVNALYVQP